MPWFTMGLHIDARGVRHEPQIPDRTKLTKLTFRWSGLRPAV